MTDSGVTVAKAIAALRKAALKKPGAWEDYPWGQASWKTAKRKIFASASVYKGSFYFGCKLPHSGEAALTLFSFASPMGYGLGKSGWVTATFPENAKIPVEILLEWLEESFEAVAGASAAKAAALVEANVAKKPKRIVKRPARKSAKRAAKKK